jgi:hypothetical protein
MAAITLVVATLGAKTQKFKGKRNLLLSTLSNK